MVGDSLRASRVTVSRVLLAMYEIERVLFRLVLVAFIVKRMTEAWVAWRARSRPIAAVPPMTGELPIVTVQLPIRDELYVVERVMRAAAALDYPRDRLEIQVLDDSDDETVARIDAVAAELRAAGTDISVLRRAERIGAKAGALAYGTERARGELIAVFDADFVPAPDFLQRVLPHFARDPKIGMVQGRWELVNRNDSLLTRAESMLLDGLMLVEQPAKAANGRPVHFNGTGGVWRRACITDAGGWSARTITEDLELSYRAIRRGWRMVHLVDVAVPTDVPRTMRAYRTQQQRWTRGNAQVLRASFGELVRGPLPLRDRAAMLARVGTRVMYVFLAFLTLSMPLTTFRWVHPLVGYTVPVDVALLAIVIVALLAFYVPAEARATGSRDRAIVLLPVVIALQIGLSLSCAYAFIAGLFVERAEFVRTPKVPRGERGAKYRVPFTAFALVEIVVGLAYVGFAGLAMHRHLMPFAAFFAFWAIAHLWTGGATLVE
jgi:cellulose synthase/poly-beta-1,6-N-acetylglucosamine synthase-like glycosyltransferase